MNDIINDTLGVLRWDELRNGYFGKAQFAPNKDIYLVVVDVDSDSPGEFIERIAPNFMAIKAREAEIRRQVAGALLANYNDNWCDEDEGDEKMNADAFQQRITLTSITFFGDGSAELCYDDGDLFLGHTVVADISATGDFQNAHLAG